MDGRSSLRQDTFLRFLPIAGVQEVIVKPGVHHFAGLALFHTAEHTTTGLVRPGPALRLSLASSTTRGATPPFLVEALARANFAMPTRARLRPIVGPCADDRALASPSCWRSMGRLDLPRRRRRAGEPGPRDLARPSSLQPGWRESGPTTSFWCWVILVALPPSRSDQSRRPAFDLVAPGVRRG